MKLALSWLASYLPGDLPEPGRLAERLTSLGLIVEGIEGAGAETLYEVDITANRPDAMNHRGLAREAALGLGRAFRDPGAGAFEETGAETSSFVSVAIEEPSLCARFTARVIEGITMRPSGPRTRGRLESIGLNPISAPVDATNHVCWDIGQPMHAYDLDKLAKGRDGRAVLVVRRARAGETLVTLDGVERRLTTEQLVIADAERVVGLAGVMGGLDTAITDGTRRLLLEAACFDAGAVRRAAKLNGMHTDASHRFERGVDPRTGPEGQDRAAALIVSDCGGSVRRGVVDVTGDPRPARKLAVRLSKLEAFLGMSVPADACGRILEALGFQPARRGDAFEVTVPSWRIDVESEVDLFEELIRGHGYDTLPETLPKGWASTDVVPHLVLEDRARDVLAGAGFFETSTYSFVSEAENAPFAAAVDGDPVSLENPLGEPFSTLRATPVIGLLAAARHGVRRAETDLALFEVSRSFARRGTAVDERRVLAFLLAGRRPRHWSEPERLVDFYDASGVASSTLTSLGLPAPRFEAATYPFLAAGRSARVVGADGRDVGWVGVLAPSLAAAWDLDDPVVGQIALDALPRPEAVTAVEAPSRFPGSEVDLTVTHPTALAFARLEGVVRAGAPRELRAVGVKGIYRGSGVPEGSVKTTITLAFGSDDRSLAREEINRWRDEAAGRLLALGRTRVDGVAPAAAEG